MPLWICIYLPFNDLDGNFPHWRTRAPLSAVLLDDHVMACSPKAYKAGVRQGTSHNTAAAMVAGIQFVQHNPELTQDRLKAVATTLLQYTPELALPDSHSLLLDVGASLSLFKGPRNLYRCIQNSLHVVGAQAHISMAPTAAGAWLMAHQKKSRRRILSMPSMVRHLNTLHISTLPMAKPYLAWLDAIGCTTLKDLNKLPRSGLSQRTSPQIVHYLDAAYGKTSMHLNWYQPPDTFHALYLLDFHTLHAHALLLAAQSLIEQLCGWLQARRQAASSLQFSLHHEKGRHACPPTCIVLDLSVPTRFAEDFLLLLKEQLQHEHVQASVIAVELHHIQSQSECEPSGDLFPDRSQHRQQENQLLDLLRARLGQHSILQPDSMASHVPEYANHWVDAGPDSQAVGQRARPHDSPGVHHPFWMLEEPVQLDTKNDRPVYRGHALRLVQGPERIESGWRQDGQHLQRDYFVASDNQHCRYWIYRQRGSDDPRWFLHGLFA